MGVRKVSNSLPLNSFDAIARSISPPVGAAHVCATAAAWSSKAVTITRSVSASRGFPANISIALDFSASFIPDIMHSCPSESRAVGWHLHVPFVYNLGVVRGHSLHGRGCAGACAVGREAGQGKTGSEAALAVAQSHTRNWNGAGADIGDRRIQGRRRRLSGLLLPCC